jgi:hypothetical protein
MHPKATKRPKQTAKYIREPLSAYPLNPDEALRLAMEVKPPEHWKQTKRKSAR